MNTKQRRKEIRAGLQEFKALADTEQTKMLAELVETVSRVESANVGLAQESHDLQQICRDAYEVWAGSEGIPAPQTAAEAYLLQLLTNMKDEVKRGLK